MRLLNPAREAATRWPELAKAGYSEGSVTQERWLALVGDSAKVDVHTDLCQWSIFGSMDLRIPMKTAGEVPAAPASPSGGVTLTGHELHQEAAHADIRSRMRSGAKVPTPPKVPGFPGRFAFAQPLCRSFPARAFEIRPDVIP